ncbi:hypothetical protein M0804_000965 [Polistes exclamans]|nr:hypothetical protein M0804_000965 [Polistes exclamans]
MVIFLMTNNNDPLYIQPRVTMTVGNEPFYIASTQNGAQNISDDNTVELPNASSSNIAAQSERCNSLNSLGPSFLTVKLGDDYFRIPKSLSVFMMKEPNPNENDSIKKSVVKEKNSDSSIQTRSKQKRIKENIDITDDLDDTPLDFRKMCEEKNLKTKSDRLVRLKKKPYSCEICHFTFDRKSKLTSHMFKHSNSRPHKCRICSKGFKTGAYLSRHMEIHDEPAQLHACTLCDFKARTKPYLKIHYIRKHTEDYNYSCEQCGKMFKVQSDYTTHMKDHDTESCVCDICGSSYPSKSSLYFHKHYKHKTKIKEFECSTCRKKFKSQKNLDNHAELHKMKYVCEQCGMEFKFKYGLTKHLRTHSGEKSYLCAICGKTFGCLSSQKIHLLKHVGERPYVCDICGQSFTQRSPMMLHRRKHPGVHPPPPPIKITNLLHGVQDKIIINTNVK